MKVGIIGSGRVGTNLGRHLKTKGLDVKGFYDQSHQSSKESAVMIDCVVYEQLGALVSDVDLIIIAVNDDSIMDVANQLESLDYQKKVFAHTSGVHSLEVLSDLNKNDSRVMSIHPLSSVASKSSDNLPFESGFVTIEFSNDQTNKQYFLNLFEHGVEFKGDKGLYHAAACMTSNYLNTLLNKSYEMFVESSLSSEDALMMMRPLVEGSVFNFFKNGPDKSLTGPISRGDTKTVSLHRESLKGKEDLDQFYTYLGLETVDLAYKNNFIDIQKKSNLTKELK